MNRDYLEMNPVDDDGMEGRQVGGARQVPLPGAAVRFMKTTAA